tara:strand:+ start:111 stop:509 length:399 start_codon:yes stop_codon:yes gene_type:complete
MLITLFNYLLEIKQRLYICLELLTKTKTIMKTIENLQAEVEKLGNESKAISNNVDLRASYKGIDTFNADMVINKLNTLATYHENLSVKYNDYAKDNLNNSQQLWANEADGHYQSAKEVRELMIDLVRTQKQL